MTRSLRKVGGTAGQRTCRPDEHEEFNGRGNASDASRGKPECDADGYRHNGVLVGPAVTGDESADTSREEITRHLAIPVGSIGPTRIRALRRLCGILGRLAAVGTSHDEAGDGVDCGAQLEQFELRYQGQRVGRLLVAPRAGQDRLGELNRAAMEPLADLAAPAVSALSLREELEASRAQLAAVREVERRRLRRDLHDGIGPSLAAIRLRVDTAVALLPPGSPSGSLLTGVSRELTEVGAEIRRIIEDLPPPELERLGLAGALAELVRRLSNPALPIRLVLPDRLPGLPPAVELAAYRITAEALGNAVRHSAATHATVRVAEVEDGLLLTVTDDGTSIRSGAGGGGLGLRSMAARAADIGGTCQVHGGRDGTTVTARLPHASAVRAAPRR